MNNNEIGEYDYYNLTNNKIFIKGNCDELCKKLLKDLKINLMKNQILKKILKKIILYKKFIYN